MRYMLAVLLPGLAVILCGRLVTGLLLLLLQVTLIGWIPAVIVAWLIVAGCKADKRAKRQTRAITGAINRQAARR